MKELPHNWVNRYSTKLNFAHFEKQHMGKRENAWHKKEKPLGNHYLSGIYSLSKNLKFSHSESEHDIVPNVIVAHLKDGIEVIHFWSGRPLTHLSLPAGPLYMDINGDGTIDTLRVQILLLLIY